MVRTGAGGGGGRGGGGGGGCRSQSTQSGGSSGVGRGLVVVAGSTSLLAGLVGYSAWSDDNRKVGVGVGGWAWV